VKLINDSVVIAISQASDGSMSKAVSEAERNENRKKFLNDHDIAPELTVLVYLQYADDDYCRYLTVGKSEGGEGISKPSNLVSDALFTRERGLALFLPIADCIGAVLYDPVNHIIGLAHLGRHNLVQSGASKAIDYMHDAFGTSPADLLVWMSPAAGRESYPLYDFNNQGMHDVAWTQLLSTGVMARNIIIDERDTTTDSKLFSHSEFLKGNRETDGRQAVVAMMR